MKNLAICVSCLFASLSIFAQSPQTFKCEIMDSQCAALGGHQIMEQKGESAKDCTNRCVNMGGKYTLFDSATKTAWQLIHHCRYERTAVHRPEVAILPIERFLDFSWGD